jgi:hypothetical protein
VTSSEASMMFLSARTRIIKDNSVCFSARAPPAPGLALASQTRPFNYHAKRLQDLNLQRNFCVPEIPHGFTLSRR